MATASLSSRSPSGSAVAVWSPGAVLIALAIPILFLHVHYQPGFTISVGSLEATAYLSDFVVWLVAAAALVEGVRLGFAPLRAGWPIWVAAGAFFTWLAVAVAIGAQRTPGYDWQKHTVTAAKLVEYALIALALPLLVRGRAALLPAFGALTIWSIGATVVGLAQFFGADIFLSGTVGKRQASFLSSLDFSSLSAATLLAGAFALSVRYFDKRLAWAAIASGMLGTILGGSMSAVLGVLAGAAVLAVLLAWQGRLQMRPAIAVAVSLAVLVVGALAIRGSDLSAFARFVGSNETQTEPAAKVQTYAHRTLLAWLGVEIWKDHPVFGSGFEASGEPGAFEPHLAAAHRHFRSEAATAFPSRDPERRYGVQNLYVQTLADLGVLGAALLVALFGAAVWVAVRAVRAGILLGALAAAWLALLLGLWTAQGYVAGLPLDALTWFTFGLAATAAAWRHTHA